MHNQFVASDIKEALRENKGRHVTLMVRPGPEELSGHLRGLLESDDGLVAFLADDSGRLHTVHYHLITAVQSSASP